MAFAMKLPKTARAATPDPPSRRTSSSRATDVQVAGAARGLRSARRRRR